jgi:diguanylate cyclase (GGDEF)-like protein
MDAEVKDSHVQAPIPPLPATWRQLAYWDVNRPVGHQFDLVSIEGQVVKEVHEAARDEFVLSGDGQLFTAVYKHPPLSTSQLSSIVDIPPGSIVRVTGICMVVDPDPSNKGQEAPFDIRLRSLDDIAVVARPSWLNTRNLTRMVILLLLAVILAAAWGLLLMRKVHRQTSAIAARTEAEASLERRRSRILEDINGARPLSEIIEAIAEMVSFKLNGAPCCCQIAGGARFGACPPETDRLRIVRMEIHGHSGPLLGEFIAGLDPHSQPASDETEALSVGAGLAALAIESRRLYSDLLHRSEFDQLTEVHNRFSLDKRLEAQIEEARLKASIFGLIYIDLDKFKQINDLHGHNVGDLYLQEVALRMKGQLRAVDLLARLGGDEFAVLVPVVRSRMDVEEIAQRLERCFDNPFTVEDLTLHGSASVGFALYPEGGDNKDSLLNAADAAMYAVKNSRQQVGEKA